MIFRRKAYDKLLEWKKNMAGKYCALLEGARRVGKTTIAEEFAKKEYKSYIIIDFSNVSNEILKCFDDISDINRFFIRLQTLTGITLKNGESVVVFDEIQLFPKARQAIKHLVKDGRYDYIETGSLISIKKNVKDILIPSEEHKIVVYPMDYEEFLWATGNDTYELLRQLYQEGKPIGQQVNRKLMKDFRMYMAVGGMPQAVKAYVDGASLSEVDFTKREIISLYEDDFKKIDSSGRIFSMYKSVPAQLASGKKKYSINTAIGKRKNQKSEEMLYDLIDSKTINIAYNTTDPRVSLSGTKDMDSYKIYLGDTGLFVTLLFSDREKTDENIYAKLLSDKLPANLGYLYENVVAQMIASSGRELYYHTWEKQGSTHYYELDFIISNGVKNTPIEVKSSGIGKHESLTEAKRKYRQSIYETVILSQKDIGYVDDHKNFPIYLTPFLVENTHQIYVF